MPSGRIASNDCRVIAADLWRGAKFGVNGAEMRVKLRVLAVEDDALILMNTVDTLEEMGCVVSEASRGGEALALLEAGAVDVLLTDVGLPDMSGVELAQRAVAMWPGLAVVFATGRSDIEGLDRFARAAMLPKPYDYNDLEAVLLRFAPGSSSDLQGADGGADAAAGDGEHGKVGR